MKRAAEWFLTLKEVPLEKTHTFITATQHTGPDTEQQEERDEPTGPVLYGTGLDATEGLWERTGWAGRG